MISLDIPIGVVRGLITLVLLLAFIGMVIYVYSKRNRSTYEQAASLPLEDDAVVTTRRRNVTGVQ